MQRGIFKPKDWKMVPHWFSHRGGLVIKDDVLFFWGGLFKHVEDSRRMLQRLHDAQQGITNMLARVTEF